VPEASNPAKPGSSWLNDTIVSGVVCDGHHRMRSMPASLHTIIVTVSVNPGTASLNGTSRPTILGGSVVVVDGRFVGDATTVSPVNAVLDVAASSSGSDSAGDGDLSNQPKMNAATTNPATPAARSHRP
jgi:hypothetical protein